MQTATYLYSTELQNIMSKHGVEESLTSMSQSGSDFWFYHLQDIGTVCVITFEFLEII